MKRASGANRHGTTKLPGSFALRATGVLILLAIVIGLVFGRVCQFQFITNWDDDANVVDNPDLNPPNLAALKKYWSAPQFQLYTPCVFMVWGGLAQWAYEPPTEGHAATLDPSVFHCANLVVHLFVCFLAWLIIRRLLADSPRRDLSAALGALLFAVHPLQVEPVAWVTGMKDLLTGLFSLASLLLYVEAMQCRLPNQIRKTILLLLLASLAYLLALFSKPSAVSVPLVAVILGRGWLGREWRWVLPAPIGWLLLAIAPIMLTRSQQLSDLAFVTAPLLRPFVAFDAIGFYMGKLLLPLGMSIDPGRPPVRLVLEGTLRWSWIPGFVVCLLLWICRRRYPRLAMAGLIFLAGVLPVLGLSPFGFQRISTVADRYAYLAMIGPALLLAVILARASGRLGWCVAIVGIVVLSMLSFVDTGYWENRQTVMLHALDLNPQSQPALAAMGTTLHDQGNLPEAQLMLTRALALNPDDPDALFDLGNVLLAQRKVHESIWQYRRALQLSRGVLRSKVLMNLGVAYFAGGQQEESEKAFREGIGHDPANPALLSGLGRVLEAEGKSAEAMSQYRAALAISPQFPQAVAGVLRLSHPSRRN